MDADTILSKLNEVFRDELDDESISLSNATMAKDIEGWDSLAHVRLLVATEVAFGIRFGSAEIGGLENVGALVALIAKKLGA